MAYITLFLYFVVWPAAIFCYGAKIVGRENLEKDKRYIFTSNHQSYIDPPLISAVANHPVAYMAKAELYTHKNPLIRFLVISLGAFAVNRDKPESATIKTILDIIKHTKWSIGIFPQGATHMGVRTFDDVKGGFVSIAKLAKMDIVPVAICNFRGYNIIPVKEHLVLKVGKPISYELSEDEILTQWKTYMEQNVE